MLKRIFFLFFLVGALFLPLFFKEHSAVPYTEFEGIAMTIPYRLKVEALFSEEKKKEIQTEVERIFSHIHAVYNPWNPCSEISLINNSKKGEKTVVSSELFLFLEKVVAIFEKSHTLFDPTASSFSAKGNFNSVHVEEGCVFKDEDNLKIDLCETAYEILA